MLDVDNNPFIDQGPSAIDSTLGKEIQVVASGSKRARYVMATGSTDEWSDVGLQGSNLNIKMIPLNVVTM